jgi:hypothetical protein
LINSIDFAMKFSDFKNIAEMLAHFGLVVQASRFIEFDKIQPLELPSLVLDDLEFMLANRGNTDMEAYACEALIFPILKEAWKRHPKAKLFSHPQIKFEDLILVPDYVVAPRNKTGINIFEKPLLVTIEAKNDDYELGWADAYRQLIVARLLNENPDIPIYAIVSIGDGWQFGKLAGNTIYKHPLSLGLAQANQLFGVLDFVFADCVKTAEKFNLY